MSQRFLAFDFVSSRATGTRRSAGEEAAVGSGGDVLLIIALKNSKTRLHVMYFFGFL